MWFCVKWSLFGKIYTAYVWFLLIRLWTSHIWKCCSPKLSFGLSAKIVAIYAFFLRVKLTLKGSSVWRNWHFATMLVFDQNSSSCSCVAAVTRRHFSEELDLYSFALLLLSHGLRRCLCEGSGSVDITFGLILCN